MALTEQQELQRLKEIVPTLRLQASEVLCPVLREICLGIVESLEQGRWRQCGHHDLLVLFDTCMHAGVGHTQRRLDWLRDHVTNVYAISHKSGQRRVFAKGEALKIKRAYGQCMARLAAGYGFGLLVLTPKENAVKVLEALCAIETVQT